MNAWPEAIKQKNDKGDTPLFCALKNKFVSKYVFQLLFKAWPDSVMGMNDEGSSPIQSTNTIIDAIIMDTCGCTRLHYVTKHKYVSVKFVTSILDIHPEAIKTLDINGDTFLHHAVRNKYTSGDLVKEILKKICPIHSPKHVLTIQNHQKQTPLHYAALNEKPSVEVLKVLVESWSRGLGIKNQYEETPLHCAALNKNSSIKELYCLLRAYPEVIL